LDGLDTDLGMVATANFTQLMGPIRFLTDAQIRSKKLSRKLVRNYFPRAKLQDADRHRSRTSSLSRASRQSQRAEAASLAVTNNSFKTNTRPEGGLARKSYEHQQVHSVFKRLMTSMLDQGKGSAPQRGHEVSFENKLSQRAGRD
jgi:FKBP-type peptidyl-prolyl cis-trans isomerase